MSNRKKKLILVPSAAMDSNKKADRNENGLVRMAEVARKNMGFGEEVEVYTNTSTEDRLRSSMLLKIFQAFSKDIKVLREKGFPEEDLCRVGFVTTKTHQKICGNTANTSDSIWVTDSVEDTVIGADPEFVLLDNDDRLIRATNVIGFSGELGSDGSLAELRPKPEITAASFVTNIKSLFENQTLTKDIRKYKWMSGCLYSWDGNDYAIGGHIHIGNPIQITKLSSDKRERFFRVLNKIIDELVAIPLIKLDGEKNGSLRRKKCGYGKYGQHRTDKGRLEHRTLSGMWITHPTIAEAVLGTIKAVVDEVFLLVADKKFDSEYMFPSSIGGANVWSSGFDGWNEIQLAKDMRCVLPSSKMIALLHDSGANKISKAYLKTWLASMNKLSTFGAYTNQIESLHDILRLDASTIEKLDRDLKKNWLEGKKLQ